MKRGVVFPQTEIVHDPVVIRDFAQAIEEMGFDYLLAYDHVVGVDPARRPDWPANGPYRHTSAFQEPLVLFAYLAGVTSRIEFSTAVIILPQRQTVLFAKQAANVDILCGGRLRLAMGVGWNDAEYEALGVDFHSRGKKLDEQIPLLRRLWLEDALTFDGRFHHIRGAGINPLPVQRPIPLWIGGLSDSAMRRAASIGDGWSPVFPGKEAPERIGIFHEAVVKAGRDPARVGFEIIVMSGATVGGPILSPEQSAAEFKAFRAAGASHGAVHTMGVGLKTLDAHLKYLEAYKIHTTK